MTTVSALVPVEIHARLQFNRVRALPPVWLCRGTAKLGEDHPDTLTSLNNLAKLLQDQGHLADAEPLYHEALKKSPGAQFQRDFMHSIRSRNLLDFHLLSFSLVVLLLLRRPGANSVAGFAFCEM